MSESSQAYPATPHTLPYRVIFEELEARGRLSSLASTYTQDVKRWRDLVNDLHWRRVDQASERSLLAAASAELDDLARRGLNKQQQERLLARVKRHRAFIAEQQLQCQKIELRLRDMMHAANLNALCLSGGGIRSASFSLGAIQELARFSDTSNKLLLPELDYISTVSGGGYTGAWLTSLIRRASLEAAGQGFSRVIEKLRKEPPETSVDPEVRELRHVREYSNYLTPRCGLASLDTWTLIATYCRNLLLNTLVLIPFVAAVLLVPQLVLMLPPDDMSSRLLGSAILALTLLATIYIWRILPDADRDICRRPATASYRPFGAMVSAIALLAVLYVFADDHAKSGFWPDNPLVLAFVSGLIVAATYILGDLSRGLVNARLHERLTDSLKSLVGVAVGAALLVVLLILARRFGTSDRYVLLLGPPAVLICLSVAGSVMNALKSTTETEEEREWWARSGAWLFTASIVWLIALAVPITAERIVETLKNYKQAAGGSLTAIAIGFLASKFASSSLTPNRQDQNAEGHLTVAVKLMRRLNVLLPAIAIAFFALLAIGISVLNHAIVRYLSTFITPDLYPGALGVLRGNRPIGADRVSAIMWFVILLSGSLLLSWVVNVNTFSLHGMYRMRLIRAFMGAANDRRWPFPFINFDPADNFPLAEATVSPDKPIHVVNCALNVVATKNLAWQQRKAEPFTFTPLHSGSMRVGYVPTSSYAGRQGVTLGTAMAISGAAANPNMGYHSSAVVTALMTLFNVRLGWWLPNPKAEACYHSQPSPKMALRPLLFEASGFTTDESRWVNLSDGGHFDNLGLYEMVMRRVHTIIVLDASADPEFSFEDLGNACRKIYIDLGVPIDFDDRNITKGVTKAYCAIGTIHYHCVDGLECGADVNTTRHKGYLVYIKASLNGTEPADVAQYAGMHRRFPHESTTDQFYSEMQLESYRRLGAHIISYIIRGSQRRPVVPISIQQFLECAKARAPLKTASPGGGPGLTEVREEQVYGSVCI